MRRVVTAIAVRLGLVAASLLVAVVMLEAATRVYRYGFDALLPWIVESIRPVGSSPLIRPSPFVDIRYEYLPNLDTYFKKAHFRTNGEGLHDQEYARRKPAGTYRVAVIGDSMTVPEGVEIEDAFHSVLERRATAESGRSVEFVNFAVGGHQLPEYLAMIRHRALEWQPDLVVIGFCVNDFWWDEAYAAAHFQKPYEPLPTIHPFFRWHVIDWIQELRDGWRFRPKPGPLPEWGPPEPNRAWMARELAEFGSVSAEARIPFVFVYLLTQSHGYVPLGNDVRAAVTAHGMHFVDPSVAFPEKADPARYFIYRADGHGNAAAQRIFADTLYDYLTSGAIAGFPVRR